MSETAKSARAANKSKAHRMANGDPHAKVDASSWTPPENMNANAQTGMRPVSRRQFKSGGKVNGSAAAKRADKKPRKSGGRASANDYVNRNVREANHEIAKPHVGGFKKGGHADEKSDKKLIRKMVKPAARTGKDGGGALGGVGDFIAGGGLGGMAIRKLLGNKKQSVTPESPAEVGKKRGGAAKCNDYGGSRPEGGRMARKAGGRTGKGKTNINIIIGSGRGHEQPQMPAGQVGPVRPPVPVPPPAPPQQAMPVPMPMPGAGAGLPPPPMARKAGGRVGNRRYASFKDMDAGAGGGLGRLEKTEIQKRK